MATAISRLDIRASGTQPKKPVAPRPEVRQRLLKGRNKRQQERQFVRSCVHHQHRDWQLRYVLLIRKVLVDGDERIEACGGQPQQLAILDA